MTHAAVVGPPGCGIPWVRRHLARHPMLAVPEPSSGFWDRTYGIHPGARPRHWGQAFFGLGGRRRVECCEGLASLPSWKIGALAAHNPGIRIAFAVRDPVERSWASLRGFHARDADALGLGSGVDWVDDAVRGRIPQAPDLLAEGDYAGMLRRWSSHLDGDAIEVFCFDELEAIPEESLDWIATVTCGVYDSPDDFGPDGGPGPGSVDGDLPDEPPPKVVDLLAALHRRQVDEAEAMLGEAYTESWTR